MLFGIPMSNPTQAMILAAGEGTRMRPLTLTTPKPLLKVGEKELIVWHIEKLIKNGITDIVINARYLSDKLVAFFANHVFDANIRLSLENHFAEPIETAGGIAFALEQGLLKHEPFVLVNGDVWTDVDFGELTRVDLGDKLGHLYLINNPAHHLAGDFLLLDNGLLADEAGRQGERLTFAGLSVLSPQLFVGTPIGVKAPLAPILRTAINQAQLSGEKLTANWVDVGTPERLAELNCYLQVIEK